MSLFFIWIVYLQATINGFFGVQRGRLGKKSRKLKNIKTFYNLYLGDTKAQSLDDETFVLC